MPEVDPLVLSFSHLSDFPRAKDALFTLQKVASLVKPIMRARGWKVGQLAEFFPDQANLLGLNVNAGQRILLRLRHAGDRTQFVPLEQVIDTMLHELSHIVHGPHDAKFHALWNQLRDEHQGLVAKGYTGEGFLSEGRRLGGRDRIPMHEARRLARQAAEKRRTLAGGSGQRLGGAGPGPGDIRRTIIEAVERRNKIEQGCGNNRVTDGEMRAISETATRNGFRTQAEEDAANEAAIAQALWELVQEDERNKYGDGYVPPSQANPLGSGGAAAEVAAAAGSSKPLPSTPPSPPRIPIETKPTAASTPIVAANDTTRGWTCEICTLHNPSTYLCCDACGTERPERTITKPAPTQKRRAPAMDLTKPTNSKTRGSGSAVRGSGALPAPPPPTAAQTWKCSFCGTRMDRQWWTCSTCGVMKDNSR